jgi:hypothetical protein
VRTTKNIVNAKNQNAVATVRTSRFRHSSNFEELRVRSWHVVHAVAPRIYIGISHRAMFVVALAFT